MIHVRSERDIVIRAKLNYQRAIGEIVREIFHALSQLGKLPEFKGLIALAPAKKPVCGLPLEYPDVSLIMCQMISDNQRFCLRLIAPN